MKMDAVFLHSSTDVIACDIPLAVPKYIKAIETYANFAFAHNEKDVVQGSGSGYAVKHQALGMTFKDRIGSPGDVGVNPKNGSVNLHSCIAQLNCGFYLRLAQNTSQPIFAIIDHNSFHHGSYIMASYAAYKYGSALRAKRLVISFNYHTDTKTLTKDDGDLRCDNWLSCCLLQTARGICDYTMHIGQNKTNADGVFNKTGWYTSPTAAEFSNICTESTVKEQVKNFITQKAITEVYVSVDRDFMKQSYTPYKDGLHSVSNARQAVKDCLTGIKEKGVALIGFDICGMPAKSGQSLTISGSPSGTISLTGVLGKERNAVVIAFEDIKQYYEAVAAF